MTERMLLARSFDREMKPMTGLSTDNSRPRALGRGVVLVALGLLLLAWAAPAQAQETDQDKRARTGMKFLSVSVDPQAAALGDAVTARERGVASLFYNPAGMARQETGLSLMLAQAGWIADIAYNNVGFSVSPAGGRFGVFGISLLAVDYGSLTATVRADNEQGFERVGEITPSAFALGLGYARALTDRFAVGGHVKWVRQDLGESIEARQDGGGFAFKENTQRVVAFDFGMLYKTGFRSLNFAVTARNFAREVAYEEESFELPLTVRIGVSMNVMDLTTMNPDVHALFLSVDAETPRDYEEQIKIGGEYLFMDTVSLRAGYILPTDEQGINLGLGVQQELGRVALSVDYAYSEFGVFNDSASLYGLSGVHRVALQIGL